MARKPNKALRRSVGLVAAIAGAAFAADAAKADTITATPLSGDYWEGDVVLLTVTFANFDLAYTGFGNFLVSGASPSGTVFPFAFNASGYDAFERQATVTFADEGVVTWQADGERSNEGSSGPFNVGGGFTVHNVDPIIDTPQGNETVDFSVSSVFNFSAAAIDVGVNDTLTYNWDLDGDGLYDDYTGPSGSIDLASLIPGATNGVLNLGLRVDDGDGGEAINPFEVTVTGVPEPASLCLLALGATAMLRRRK